MLEFSCFVTGECGLRYVAKMIARRLVCFNAETGGTARVKLGGGVFFNIYCWIAVRYFFTLGWREHRCKFSELYEGQIKLCAVL